MFDFLHTAYVVGGTLFVIFGIIVGWKKSQQASDARNNTSRSELIKLLESSRDEWRTKCESDHQEFVKYRDEAHLKINQCTDQILQLSQDNAQLKMRTDMAPIMALLGEQGKVMERVVKALDKLEASIVAHIQYLPQNPQNL